VIAKANNIAPDTQVKIGQRLTIPGIKPAAVATQPPAPPAKQAPPLGATKVADAGTAKPPKAAPAAPPAGQKTAPPRTAQMAAPAEPPSEPAAESTGSAPTFRWPVRGRIIAGFGPKNGQQNDGINLAVPEGTSIKASEDGVVAYAGNELKGYGNLILVRHSNGFVTAYAHASELLVKRNDPVKRGQIIARA